MAKYGYQCQCGWQIERKHKTRKMYAALKEIHAEKGCESMLKELKQSGKFPPNDNNPHWHYAGRSK